MITIVIIIIVITVKLIVKAMMINYIRINKYFKPKNLNTLRMD